MISSLRKRIELLAETRTDDEGGGAALSWTVAETIWAAIEEIASAQTFAGERKNSRRRLAITIRQRSSILPGARIRTGGADFEIVSVESADGKGRRMILVCEEVV